LRLAAELTQLARETSDPDLKSQFLRAAAMWSNQALQGHKDDGEPSQNWLTE
jgi:hypothetical protein